MKNYWKVSTSIRAEIIQSANIFRGRIIDVSPETMTVEVTGDSEKIDAFLELLKAFGIKELARTGPTAMSRGSRTI